MATYTIQEGYVYLTNGTISNNTITDKSGNSYTVRIAATKIEDDSTASDLLEIDMATPTTDHEAVTGTEKAPSTWIIDLNRSKRVITVTGHLEDDKTADSSRTPAYAYQAVNKKNLLHKLYNYGSSANKTYAIKIVWGVHGSQANLTTRHSSSAGTQDCDETYTSGIIGKIIKMRITESAGMISEDLGDSDYNVAVASDAESGEFSKGARKFDVMFQFLIGESKF